MNKKYNIVIQCNSITESMKLILDVAEKRKDEINFTYAKNSDFEIRGQWHSVEVFLQGQRLCKENFDAIYLRTTLKYKEAFMLIAEYAHKNGVFVLDYEGMQKYGEKLYNMLFISKSDFLHIPTYSSMEGNIPKNLPFDFPMIYKPAIGKQGQWVEKINNHSELENILKNRTESYILQKFIPNSGDIRVIIIGEKILWAMKRTSAKWDFRNNLSLGGSAEKYELSPKLYQKIENFIKNSGVQYDFYGLDIIEDTENPDNHYIMEYDRSIQFKWFTESTGVSVADELFNFIISKINENN